jgi:hypothetical protein
LACSDSEFCHVLIRRPTSLSSPGLLFITMHLLVVQTSQVKHYQIRYCVLYCRVVCGDITPCSPLKANRNFRETCRLHLQGRRISRARNQSVKQVASRALVSCSDYSLILEMEAKYFDETSMAYTMLYTKRQNSS